MNNKNKTKYEVWLRLQRKIKSLGYRIETTNCVFTRNRLLRKLKLLTKRLFGLNRKWHLGFAATAILVWLGSNNINAQSFLNHAHFEQYSGVPVYNAGTPSMYKPDLVDIDGDGDLDLFYGTNNMNNKMAFHENIGTPEVAQFDSVELNPFGIDALRTMAPRFVDIDGDGDFDLLSAVYDNGSLYYFENSGSAISPNFEAPQTDPFGFVQYGDDYSTNAIDVADIDGDGDFDLLSVTYYGDVVFYENIGTPESADFSEQSINPFGLSGYIAHTELGLTQLTEGAPAFMDVDNDGDYDLFVGTWKYDVQYFENYGSVCRPLFDTATTNPFNITYADGSMRREAPAFGDLDGDGDEDMFLGFSQYPNFYYYEFEGVEPTEPKPCIDLVPFGELDATQAFTIVSNNPGWNREVAFGDFNGDGFDDFVFSSLNNDCEILFGDESPDSSIKYLADVDGADGFLATTAGDNYGMATVDMDKDGFDDIVMGQPYDNSTKGNNYMLFGHSGVQDALVEIENPGSNRVANMSPSSSQIQTGYSVLNVGDINGDGFDDLYSMCYYDFSPGVVLFADEKLPDSLDIDNDLDSSNSCKTVQPYASAHKGDINGDGYGDIIEKNNSLYWGIMWGDALVAEKTVGPILIATDSNIVSKIQMWGADESNQELLSVFDFDNDGYDDMLFYNLTKIYYGDPGNDTLILVYGSPSKFKLINLDTYMANADIMDGENGKYITGLPADNQFESVTTLDFNGDGYGDVVFTTTRSKETYVVYGTDNGEDITDVSNLTPAEGFKITGFSDNGLAAYRGGDLNADGIDDLLVMDLVPVDTADKLVAHVIYGQQTANAAYAIEELQNNGGYDLVFSLTSNAIREVKNPDFNGDGYEDAVLVMHDYSGDSEFKFLLSQVGCIPVDTIVEVVVCPGDDLILPDGSVVDNIQNDTSFVHVLESKMGCDSTVTTNIIVDENCVQNAYITKYGGSDVYVIDVNTNTITDTIAVGSKPYGVAVNPFATKVFVTNYLGNSVSVIDASTNKVDTAIAVGAKPSGIAVNLDETMVYVASSDDNTIYVIDVESQMVIDTIAVGDSPFGVVMHPEGTAVYVANYNDNTISVIETGSNMVSETIHTGGNPFGLAINKAGSSLYVANYSQNTISVINTYTNTVIDTIAVGANPYGVSVNYNDTKIYVANNGNNTVSVIDAITNTATETIPVGNSPSSVAFNASGTKAFVTNYYTNIISIVDAVADTVQTDLMAGPQSLSFGNFIGRVVSRKCVDVVITEDIEICTGEDYTYPDGTTESNITENTAHVSNLVSVSGCDSIITTNISINPVYDETEEANLCFGQDYTYPDGTTETNIITNTSHISNLISVSGCDSTITTNITINEVYALTEDVSLCAGENYTYPDGTTESNIMANTSHISNLVSILGCDSTITTNISVFPVYDETEDVNLCSGQDYTYPDGTTETNITTNTSYISNLVSVSGCDSTITTNIAVNEVYLFTENVSLCAGENYTYPDGTTETNIMANTSHISNLVSVLGCDSTITTNIAVDEVYLFTENVSLCAGENYTYPDGTTESNIMANTSHISNLVSVLGCDSTITTNISVYPIYNEAEDVNICSGGSYTYPDGTTQTNIVAKSTHVSNLTSEVTGCDSTITTSISIISPVTSTENQVVCLGDDFTFPDGTMETNVQENTMYKSTITSLQTGCDSIVTTFLRVNEMNTTVMSYKNYLIAQDTTAQSYKWFTCGEKKKPVKGQKDFVFEVEETGLYALVIESDGCADTSACIPVIVSAIENQQGIVQSLWPNPSTGKVYFALDQTCQQISLSVYDINGRIVKQEQLQLASPTFSTEIPGRVGVYYIRITSQNKTAVFKILKKVD